MHNPINWMRQARIGEINPPLTILSILGIPMYFGLVLESARTSQYVTLIICATLHCLDSRLQPFTHEFPRAEINEILTPDLLHQVIKGTFKDHLVTWVHEYLYEVHGTSRANAIVEDIDRWWVLSIFLVPV
jgi:hypothetical protein